MNILLDPTNSGQYPNTKLDREQQWYNLGTDVMAVRPMY